MMTGDTAIAALRAVGVPRADAAEAVDHGVKVELVSLTAAGGHHGQGNGDGGSGGDGCWMLIKAPSGGVLATIRPPRELSEETS